MATTVVAGDRAGAIHRCARGRARRLRRDARGRHPGLTAAWHTLRIVECARCHGKHYTGLAAPSIVDYVRTRSREQFDHIVLVGDPPRGMPGYRRNPLIAETIDDLYRYFRDRASGRICADARPPSRPGPAAPRQQHHGATD